MTINLSDWEKRFDEHFGEINWLDKEGKDFVRSFISKLLQEAREQGAVARTKQLLANIDRLISSPLLHRDVEVLSAIRNTLAPTKTDKQ